MVGALGLPGQEAPALHRGFPFSSNGCGGRRTCCTWISSFCDSGHWTIMPVGDERAPVCPTDWYILCTPWPTSS